MSKSKKPAAKVAIPARSKLAKAKSPTITDRKTSKSDQVLSLLRRKQGASLEEMQKVSGWQAHSVRGHLSATVKKQLGLKLNSTKSPNGERRYTIAAS
jgi:hypothetical protein